METKIQMNLRSMFLEIFASKLPTYLVSPELQTDDKIFSFTQIEAI